MSEKYEVLDMFELLAQAEEEKAHTSEHRSVDELLVESLNRFGAVDINFIAKWAGVSVKKAVDELKGAIYQLPEVFTDNDSYDITKGWVVSSRYLSGNILRSLDIAKKMNLRFPGKFQRNIDVLQKMVPALVDIDDIHLSLGAAWIPVEEYQKFICDFLNLRYKPKITLVKEIGRIKIEETAVSKLSVLNTITYGVRDDNPRGNYTKQYLTAIKIIEQTANAKTIKVFDYIPKYGGKFGFEYEPLLNRNKTFEAQEKQKALSDAFKDWVYSDRTRRKRFEDYYNVSFVGYSFSQYDGEFLKFPDLNPEISFYKHQKDAIARVLLSSSNVLLAHDVGTGKTYEIVASVHELWRMGISAKNLVVVPNNVLKATVEAHKLLYKDDKILAVYPKDFTPDFRNEVLVKIRDNSYTAVYMAYSSFDMITMSKKYHSEKIEREITKLRNAELSAKDTYEKRALKRQADLLTNKHFKLTNDVSETPWLNYEELGIETLVIDEAHNYKNIPIVTRAENIVGLNCSGSKKCREMLEKVHTTSRVIFATGTPLTNSIADLFTLQTYLQPELLKFHRIDNFDAWINTFGQRETFIECDVDANSTSLRTMTRFSSFYNLTELMALFSQVCDFHHIEENAGGLPGYEGHTDLCVEKNTPQTEYISELSKRADLIRSKKVSRKVDNLLKVTTDGRKAALDIRLTDTPISTFIDRKTKIQVCGEKVFELYKAHPHTAQIVFSDIGTPKAGFNVYNCLKDYLVSLGIAESQIAFAHDAVSESARSRLFKDINKGKVRVVIGSTQKLGVGVNVQERLIAVHHLSVPWRPADMVQREGRIKRNGNTCKEIFIFRYITEGSFDAYSWQLLENKQRFISSFLSGTSGIREMQDIADAVLSYAEVKALAIGNPLIKKRVEVANKLERAKNAGRSRQRELQELRSVSQVSPDKIANLMKLSKIAEKEYEEYKKQKEKVTNEERIAFGEELLGALKDNIAKKHERVFDEYQGFSVVLPADMCEESRCVILKGAFGGCYYCELSLDKTELGCSKTIDYLLEHLGERAQKLKQSALQIKQQMNEANKELEKDNPYPEIIERLTEELEDIDRRLEARAKEAAA